MESTEYVYMMSIYILVHVEYRVRYIRVPQY